MPGEIGVGVRVFVGWLPIPDGAPEAHLLEDPRGKRGVLVEGPFAPMERLPGTRWRINAKCWLVHLDDGGDQFIAERLLYPIDDDGEEAVEDERELEGVT